MVIIESCPIVVVHGVTFLITIQKDQYIDLLNLCKYNLTLTFLFVTQVVMWYAETLPHGHITNFV